MEPHVHHTTTPHPHLGHLFAHRTSAVGGCVRESGELSLELMIELQKVLFSELGQLLSQIGDALAKGLGRTNIMHEELRAVQGMKLLQDGWFCGLEGGVAG